MIRVYEPAEYPAWVFVEFTAGDTDLKYELPPLMRMLCVHVNNSRYIIDKQQFNIWVETRRELYYLTVAPIWIGDTSYIWKAWINGELILTTPPTLKKPESVKPIKPPKNIPALMERNFWPTIRILNRVPDKVMRKIICR